MSTTYNLTIKSTDTSGSFKVTPFQIISEETNVDKPNYMFGRQNGTGNTIIYRSKDGLTWLNTNVTGYWFNPTYGDQKWMWLRFDTLSGSTPQSPLYYSLTTDGITFTSYTFPEAVLSGQYPVWVKDRWVYIGASSKKILTSLDGISWTASTSRVPTNDGMLTGTTGMPYNMSHFGFSSSGEIALLSAIDVGATTSNASTTFNYLHLSKDFGVTWLSVSTANAGGGLTSCIYAPFKMGQFWMVGTLSSTGNTEIKYFYFDGTSPYLADTQNTATNSLAAFTSTRWTSPYVINGIAFFPIYQQYDTTLTNVASQTSSIRLALGGPVAPYTFTRILSNYLGGTSELKSVCSTANGISHVVFCGRGPKIFASKIIEYSATSTTNANKIKISVDNGVTFNDLDTVSGISGLPTIWTGLMGIACAYD